MASPKDRSTLSTKPSQIRNRLRRRTAAFNQELELYEEHGYGKKIEDWDVEELARGRPRASDGSFRGKNPSWITPMVAREAKRRLMEHTFGEMTAHIDLAIKTVVNLMTSKAVDDWGKPIVDARTKLDCAKFIIEHVLGKPKALVEVSATDVVQQYLAASIVVEQEDGTFVPAHPVIDGQFTEDDEEDDDGSAE